MNNSNKKNTLNYSNLNIKFWNWKIISLLSSRVILENFAFNFKLSV